MNVEDIKDIEERWGQLNGPSQIWCRPKQSRVYGQPVGRPGRVQEIWPVDNSALASGSLIRHCFIIFILLLHCLIMHLHHYFVLSCMHHQRFFIIFSLFYHSFNIALSVLHQSPLLHHIASSLFYDALSLLYHCFTIFYRCFLIVLGLFLYTYMCSLYRFLITLNC